MRGFARVISVLFHPLLMTSYLFLVLTFYLPVMLQPLRPSPWFLGLIFFMTFVLPMINFVFLRISGSISDITMPLRHQRILPFIFVSILYGVVTLMFYWKFPVPNVLKLLIIVTSMIVIATVFTFFVKVSVHSLAMAGAIGILLPLNNISVDGGLLIPTAIIIAVAGAVMSARLVLNAHTPREVLIGSLTGFVIGFGGMIILF